MNDDIRESLRDYTRAVGGGLVIGLPLLYTMEVWFHGSSLPSWKILLLLAIAAVIVVGYNATAGFRRERTWAELIADSLVTVGLGVVLAFVTLVILGRIQAGDSLRDAAGMVALESIPIAFGASVAASQLGGEQTGKGHTVGPFQRLFVGAGGALLFALNVAPTEEPVMLGSATVAGEPETSEVEVDFLPAGSTVQIAFSFSAQPEDAVTVRLVGYRVPSDASPL